MRSILFRGLAVTLAVSMLSGCAFTQWTDHAFIGSPDDPPTHANREWAGAVLLPVAIVGDVISAPVQIVVLLVMGDFGIYAKPNPRYRNDVSLLDSNGEVVAVTSASQAEEISRVVASRQPATSPQLAAWSIDANGNLAEYQLSDEQQSRLLARAGKNLTKNVAAN